MAAAPRRAVFKTSRRNMAGSLLLAWEASRGGSAAVLLRASIYKDVEAGVEKRLRREAAICVEVKSQAPVIALAAPSMPPQKSGEHEADESADRGGEKSVDIGENRRLLRHGGG